MKTLYIISLMLSLFMTRIYSQELKLKNIGSDVIDFLLTKPDSINTKNAIDSVALDIIDWVLYTSTERDHELIYTIDSSNKHFLKNTDDKQAEIHTDPTTGKLYLIVNNSIFQISEKIIKHVRSGKMELNDFLPPYELDNLEKTLMQNIKGDGITAIFTCNKAAKLHEGMNFREDFENIKRTFRKDETLYIVIKSIPVSIWVSTSSFLHLKICDYYGNPILEKFASTVTSNAYGYFWWRLDVQPGIYKIHIIYNDKIDIDIPIGSKHKLEIIEILNY